MSDLISIVIPLYNGAKYLPACLQSIFEQTYPSYEIIIAYDTKTTDNSLSIITELSKVHPILIDINCDTSTGSARNRGFKKASGKYVIFMDADDELMPNYLQSFVDVFKEHPELNAVSCNYVHTDEKSLSRAKEIARNSSYGIKLYHQTDALYCALLKFTGRETFSGSPWAWMVKRDFLIDNNIEFPDYSYGDETVYSWKILGSSNMVGVSLKKTYLWIQHNTSLTTNYFSNSSWDKREQMRKDIYNYFVQVNPDFATEYKIMQERELAFIFALAFSDYKQFLNELSRYNINKLKSLRMNEPILGYLSIGCFNVSKWLFYRFSRRSASSKKFDHFFGRL